MCGAAVPVVSIRFAKCMAHWIWCRASGWTRVIPTAGHTTKFPRVVCSASSGLRCTLTISTPIFGKLASVDSALDLWSIPALRNG